MEVVVSTETGGPQSLTLESREVSLIFRSHVSSKNLGIGQKEFKIY